MRLLKAAYVLGVALAVFSTGALSQAASPASRLKISSVSNIPAARIDWAFDSGNLTSLSDARRRPLLESVVATARSLSDVASLVDGIFLNPALLDMPSDQPTFGASMRVPRQIAHLELFIEGKRHVLFVGDVFYDTAKRVRHVTAALVNQSNGYARFAIDDRTGLIVGTIRSAFGTYRVLPNPQGGQLVYRLNAEEAGEATKHRSLSRGSQLAEPIRNLEEQHVLAEFLGEAQPWYFDRSRNGLMTTVVGGELGSMDMDIDNVDEDVLRELLVRLSPLTNATGRENFRIVGVSRPKGADGGSRSVHFQQVIHGIPVDFDQEITVAPDGRIERLIVGVIDPSRISKRSYLPEGSARGLAIQAIARKSPGSLAGATVRSSARAELRFQIQGAKLDLAPVWQFVVESDQHGSNFVNVNGYTNEITTVPTDKRVDFRTFVYGTASGSPTRGSDPGTKIVIQEDNDGSAECYATNPDDCSLPKYDMPTLIIQQTRYEWELAVGTNYQLCCAGVGTPPNQQYPTWTDKVLDVVIDTPYASAAGPLYKPDTQSILIPPKNNLPITDPAYNPEASLSTDTMVHELTHAYIHRWNRSFSVHPAETSAAVNEGMADAMAGIISEMKKHLPRFKDPSDPQRDSIGQPWIIGDSPAAPYHIFQQRNLTEPVTWSHFDNASLSIHDRGQAIGHFYYRLWTTQVITNRRLVELMLQTATSIRDPDNNGYGRDDFYNALMASVKPGESALVNAINNIWNSMTPPSTTPGTAPAAPPFIAGTAMGCVSGFSTFAVSWPPSSGADGYGGYGSTPYGYEFLGDTAGPSAYVWTNYNWDLRVTAWNLYGESPLSPSGFSVTHSQCM